MDSIGRGVPLSGVWCGDGGSRGGKEARAAAAEDGKLEGFFFSGKGEGFFFMGRERVLQLKGV